MKTAILSKDEELNKALTDYRNILPKQENYNAYLENIKEQQSIIESEKKKKQINQLKYVGILLLIVAGYFAYKKFKK